jgi:hypothetical protein
MEVRGMMGMDVDHESGCSCANEAVFRAMAGGAERRIG